MTDKTLSQKEIDELLTDIDEKGLDINALEFAASNRKCNDIKTYRIPFISDMVNEKVIRRENRGEWIIIIKFENGLSFCETLKTKIIPRTVEIYKMKTFMFLSFQIEDFIPTLQAFTRTSWTIDEAERITVKRKSSSII